MKLHGVVKGKTIELETDPDLPNGQSVLVELEICMPKSNPDLASENIRQARALRERIAKRLGGRLLDSVDLIREDRSR